MMIKRIILISKRIEQIFLLKKLFSSALSQPSPPLLVSVSSSAFPCLLIVLLLPLSDSVLLILLKELPLPAPQLSRPPPCFSDLLFIFHSTSSQTSNGVTENLHSHLIAKLDPINEICLSPLFSSSSFFIIFISRSSISPLSSFLRRSLADFFCGTHEAVPSFLPPSHAAAPPGQEMVPLSVRRPSSSSPSSFLCSSDQQCALQRISPLRIRMRQSTSHQSIRASSPLHINFS